MSREEEFTHEGFVYANNIYMERKCELFEVKDIAHDFVQGAIYADQHPRKGLWDAEKVCDFLKNKCIFSASNSPVIVEFDGEELVRKLRKAMEN